MAKAADDGTPGLRPELVLVAHPDAQLRVHEGRAHAAAGDIAPLNRALDETSATPRAMFGPSDMARRGYSCAARRQLMCRGRAIQLNVG